MPLRTYESRLRPLIERLESAKAVVDQLADEKNDRELVRRLEDGSYGEADLDRLFALVEKPLRAAVVAFAAYDRRERAIERSYRPLVKDPYCRGLLVLAHPWDFATNPVDLLTEMAGDEAFGRRGAAQLGLLRRLVKKDGAEALEALIDQATDKGEHPIPRLAEEELQRILRLMGPVLSTVDVPMLAFLDDAGRIGYPLLNSKGEGVAAFQEVDK